MKKLFFIAIGVLAIVGSVSIGQDVDIWTAAAIGDKRTVERHIASGFDLDARDPLGGSSPLIVAALFGRTDVTAILVDNGASLNATNNDGATALHVAAFFCQPETVALLLDRGADTELRNRFGQTPLETVAGDWSSDLVGFYEMVASLWKLELDLERIRVTRPQVAELIRAHADGR